VRLTLFICGNCRLACSEVSPQKSDPETHVCKHCVSKLGTVKEPSASWWTRLINWFGL
jgi:hypothetical protein